MDELERLRARVRELEALEYRLEYLEAMARQLRAQAESVTGSRTWRILTAAGGLWLKLGRKTRAAPASGPVIPAEAYWRWLAECERREAGAPPGGPRFGVAAEDERTLTSLRRQTYANWRAEPEGDYLLFPAAGDELGPDALALFARAASEGADVIYCDEDVLDERGLRVEPWFKPDWSPDLMDAKDYIGRAVAVRRELAAGGPRDACARARAVVHVPRVLYHRRGPGMGAPRRVRYATSPESRVEILIPSRDARLLTRCLDALRARTDYAAYGVSVIDNSQGAEVRGVAERHGARVIDWRGRPFNYSAMNNAAAAEAQAPLLLFLNDDTEPLDPGWLGALAEHAARPEVGGAGARLLYPDGRIQHAGVVIGIFGVCGHAFKGCPGEDPTYGGLAETVRNVSAVTGACLMMRTDVFRAAGGFDENRFPVAYNDIDLCLRVLDSGKRIVYTPHAILRHHEAYSKSRAQRDPAAAEIRAFQSRWRKYVERDPFYNPNLTRLDETYGL